LGAAGRPRVLVSDWAPDAGEIVWIDFDPQLGREQAGHRPAVVLSPKAYNQLVGLIVCVPMTTRIKGYGFEVPIAGEPASVALADHVKSLDWRKRRARLKGRVSAEELETIRAALGELIG
jgi:mRNA interferase MazF